MEKEVEVAQEGQIQQVIQCAHPCGFAIHKCVPLFSFNKLVFCSSVFVVVNIIVVDHVHAKLRYR